VNLFEDDDPRTYRARVEEAGARARAEASLEVPGEPITVRIPRAMEMLGIGRSKLYELISEGEIDTIKCGSATLVVVTSLKAFVYRQRGLSGALGLDERPAPLPPRI